MGSVGRNSSFLVETVQRQGVFQQGAAGVGHMSHFLQRPGGWNVVIHKLACVDLNDQFLSSALPPPIHFSSVG